MNKLFRIFNESQQSHHFGKNWKAAEDIVFNVGCSIVKLSACLSSLSQESAKLNHRNRRKKIKSSWLSCRCTSLCARPNLFQSQSFQFWKENIFCVIWFMFWQWFCTVWTAPWKYLSDYHLIQPATASRCRWTRRTWWTSWEACRRASGSTTIGGGSKTGKYAIFSF